MRKVGWEVKGAGRPESEFDRVETTQYNDINFFTQFTCAKCNMIILDT